jgi:argininosuccinate synthase
VDLGGAKDVEEARQKALSIGAVKALTVDGKEEFVQEFVTPALRAGAIYEGQYPLATALARPLIVKHLVRVAQQEGASAIAHGCTGKGNDQVRFDVGAQMLQPGVKVIAPAREWGMTRGEEVEYARRHHIPVPVDVDNPYSIDENLWGRSIECGVLEDPWQEPPEDIYTWTRSIADSPDEPLYLDIAFEQGTPVALNGEESKGEPLIRHLNTLAGQHGVGRIEHLENRLVGIKSREVYEAPAAMVLHTAHRALEAMTLSKEQQRFKEQVAQEYADLVYNGRWFSPYREDLQAFVSSCQRYVTGIVRVKLHKGSCSVVGRKSSKSLYSYGLATYDEGDDFDPTAATGFIHIYGLPLRTQAQVQVFGDEASEEEGE